MFNLHTSSSYAFMLLALLKCKSVDFKPPQLIVFSSSNKLAGTTPKLLSLPNLQMNA